MSLHCEKSSNYAQPCAIIWEFEWGYRNTFWAGFLVPRQSVQPIVDQVQTIMPGVTAQSIITLLLENQSVVLDIAKEVHHSVHRFDVGSDQRRLVDTQFRWPTYYQPGESFASCKFSVRSDSATDLSDEQAHRIQARIIEIVETHLNRHFGVCIPATEEEARSFSYGHSSALDGALARCEAFGEAVALQQSLKNTLPIGHSTVKTLSL